MARKVMKTAEYAIKQTPTPGEFKMYSRVVDFDGQKARERLGFEPAYGMKEAVAVTGDWLRHHRLVR
jgi:nucleoside-diphosphate-sugar epimerase